MTPNERFSVLVAFFIACILMGILCAPLGAKADGAADQRAQARALVVTSTAGPSTEDGLMPPGLEPPSDLRPQTPLEWYLFYSAVSFRKSLKEERARGDRLQQDLVECNTVRSVMENEPEPPPTAPSDRSLIQARGFDWTAFVVGAVVGGTAAAAAALGVALAVQ